MIAERLGHVTMSQNKIVSVELVQNTAHIWDQYIVGRPTTNDALGACQNKYCVVVQLNLSWQSEIFQPYNPNPNPEPKFIR